MSTEAPVTAAPVPAAPASTPAAPAPAPQDTFDTRMAALTRRERDIQQQQASLKQERSGLVSKAELAAMWKGDRSKLREYLGATPEEWNTPEPTNTPVDPVQSLQSLQAELAEMKQQAAAEKQAQATSEYKNGISQFIAQTPDEYELISEFKSIDTVFDFIVDYYKENQVELSLKEACDYVENYLFTQLKTGTKAKKVQALFQTSQEPGKQPSPTLTGAAAASPAPTTQSRRLSPEESVAQAAKLIKWN